MQPEKQSPRLVGQPCSVHILENLNQTYAQFGARALISNGSAKSSLHPSIVNKLRCRFLHGPCIFWSSNLLFHFRTISYGIGNTTQTSNTHTHTHPRWKLLRSLGIMIINKDNGLEARKKAWLPKRFQIGHLTHLSDHGVQLQIVIEFCHLGVNFNAKSCRSVIKRWS